MYLEVGDRFLAYQRLFKNRKYFNEEKDKNKFRSKVFTMKFTNKLHYLIEVCNIDHIHWEMFGEENSTIMMFDKHRSKLELFEYYQRDNARSA